MTVHSVTTAEVWLEESAPTTAGGSSSETSIRPRKPGQKLVLRRPMDSSSSSAETVQGPELPSVSAGSMQSDSNVVRLDRANERMRDAFLRWQCRIRQISMRKHEGRPTSGMAPLASPVPGSVSAMESVPTAESVPATESTPVPEKSLDSGPTPGSDSAQGAGSIARIVTVLCRRPEHSATMEFRHMARRTHDPAQRREDALKFLAERYYQAPREFSDTLTASFPPDSQTAAKLLAHREYRLDFEQFSQRYRVHCTVRRLSPNNPLREATFWHNLLFNPRLPAGCIILGFEPDWPKSDAEPPHG